MLQILFWFIVLICLQRLYYIYFYKIYTCKSQKGKVFLITGANSGIGKECTRQLAEVDATVILACRNKQAAEQAIADIRALTSNGDLIFHQVDLSQLDSVRKFAEEINRKYPKIDVLINNAGVAVPPTENARTADGFEIHFGVNYLSHFLLTQLLLPKLVESAPSRIVNVGSVMSSFGSIDLADLDADRMRGRGSNGWPGEGYSNSKLAIFYHGRELAERLQKEGKNVDVRSVCPGLIGTKIHSEYRSFHIDWMVLISIPLFFLFGETTWKGGQKVVQLATDEHLDGKSGDFYMYFRPKDPHFVTLDARVQKKLWQVSEQLVQQ